MFITQPYFKQHVPQGIAKHDNEYWRFVGLTLPTPWYLCTYRTYGEPSPQTILVAWEHDLLGLINAADAISLIAVARFDTPNANPHRWNMRWAKVIWLAARDEQEEAGPLVFQLDDDDVPRDQMLRALPRRSDRAQIFSSEDTS
jgi:hypothetical protein